MWWRRRTASEERLYQRIEHMGRLAAEAAATIRQLRETSRIRAEALESLARDLRVAGERVSELERENTRLNRWIRQAQNPGDVRLLDTDPTRRYVPPPRPREYGTDTDISEAPVSACGTCGQPHPASEPCGGDIKEAA